MTTPPHTPTCQTTVTKMRLELIPIPVTDVDRALRFYASLLGFTIDHDVEPAEGVRVAQLTPPGSACSILLSEGLPGLDGTPGSLRGLHLVVDDLEVTRADLIERGIVVGEVIDHGGGVQMAGFADPDGNTWALQQLPLREQN